VFRTANQDPWSSAKLRRDIAAKAAGLLFWGAFGVLVWWWGRLVCWCLVRCLRARYFEYCVTLYVTLYAALYQSARSAVASTHAGARARRGGGAQLQLKGEAAHARRAALLQESESEGQKTRTQHTATARYLYECSTYFHNFITRRHVCTFGRSGTHARPARCARLPRARCRAGSSKLLPVPLRCGHGLLL
jgi:hypothetical protein